MFKDHLESHVGTFNRHTKPTSHQSTKYLLRHVGLHNCLLYFGNMISRQFSNLISQTEIPNPGEVMSTSQNFPSAHVLILVPTTA